ncbi:MULTISPECIES: aspartate carbamoyltransferase regulatory subunit [unclassified Porphyromonas]|uniref:aspartate carbamoyltransferase regulatory subunit n=1 Tax=unclassified Porphyromonas TaxID=2645799 RepID=UPI00052B6C6A|nr:MULTISPECIES: aspartate carbamoyltransferase regulatory subunit [unclassified Porphyromonas]KGN83157.1 aspartate carbamoyltransferase [Porphyromonas sp. COT-290 OH860]KGO00843.1 aspartate carbamoyltransferase [Porphyromonas sp. COT-290 OH3588]
MNKNTMMVESICDGTVLDHIPSDKLFAIVALLRLDQFSAPVTIGNNLESKRYGRKGIIKMTDRFFTEEEISRITILAPDIRLNVIRDFKVVEKKALKLPKEVVALVRCLNPKCITNNEPMPTRFSVVQDKQRVHLECHYCGRKCMGSEAQLL